MVAQILLLGILIVCLKQYVKAEFQQSLAITDILPEDIKRYDKMRPPKKEGQPTIVYFHVTVMGLDSIDENSMTYVADVFFAQTWKDHRLRLPENMTQEYRLLEVDWLKNMWRPDSFFKNAKSVTFQTMTIPNHYMWLYKDKTILYMVKLTLKLSCIMNFAIYPHDTQECKLQMESLSHTTDDLIFQWDPTTPLVVDENIELPQVALIRNETADCTQVYSTGNFTCLEVVFTLKRRLVYYVFNTYIPTCMIVIMSWVSFWIKPEAAPARVTLGVTSLLTLSTQHAKSQSSLPPVSYLKAVDAFMSVCTVFVFMALMEYCLINIVLSDTPIPKPMAYPAKPVPEQAQKDGPAATAPPPASSNMSKNPMLPVPDEKIEKIEKIFDEMTKNKRVVTTTRRLVRPPLDADGPWIPRHESHIMLTPTIAAPPPPPPPQPAPQPAEPEPGRLMKLTPAQERLKRAIYIDRSSRVLFPALFASLNCIYWIVFYEYL
ncbi:glycine receptor subunit alpha-4 [Scaptodrosophila lebanonensis]|uniref:Glycine receptor subunit alpha-4 n=1 Tax=Drosophila lebanonensis TaxID=7225 RepID=A0A6J2THG1_DROLE|nr:glycine receptor subunit alpha-4 [Scaptodrosophila lebanonensis]